MRHWRWRSTQDAILDRIYTAANREILDMVVRRQDMEDVVHEVIEKCLVRLRQHRWDAEPEDFEKFVRVMLHNQIRDHGRARRSRLDRDTLYFAETEDRQPEWARADRPMDEEKIAALQREILEKVPRHMQAPYALVRQFHMPRIEVATKLGMALGMLNNLVSKAQQIYRRELEERGLIDPNARAGRRSSGHRMKRSTAAVPDRSPGNRVPTEV
jgi:RNA polymerase sigma factor (sigma-70 family)